MGDWDDLGEVSARLKTALEKFHWSEATSLREGVVERITRSGEPFPVASAKDLLTAFRRKRRFADARRLAEALLETGTDDFTVAREYAQASIDDGELVAARGFLGELASREDIAEVDRIEASGLLGRVHKQLFVNARNPADPRRQLNLTKSITAYRAAYLTDPRSQLWHGINVVALCERARSEAIALTGELAAIDAMDLARRVLAAAEINTADPWHAAIRMEACIALNDWSGAVAAAFQYTSDKSLDAFEFGSTLRQLEEVWRLRANDDNEGPLLALLRDAVLRRAGGEVTIPLDQRPFTRGLQLQANFSNEAFAQLEWFQLAVERSRAVGRVEAEAGREQGTGFLVDPKSFFGAESKLTEPVLLTNWHVISENGQFKGSLPPERAFVRFGSAPDRLKVKRIVASAPELDATFVALESPPRGDHCPLRPPPLAFNRETPERVYVIGYPKGQGLSFSLHDSYWLGMDDTRLHYRTPTTPGSSGSPVFDQSNWEVVALHHGGGNDVERLNGEAGFYQANEGILIDVIRQAVRGCA